MLSKLLTTTALGLTAAVLALGAAKAADEMTKEKASYEAGPITITGSVIDTDMDGFDIKYGVDQQMSVQTDEWNWSDKSEMIQLGEKVTVYGDLDENLFDQKQVEAGGIYVHDRNTYYFSDTKHASSYTQNLINSALDEVPDDAYVSVKGEITEINGEEFILSMGPKTITIDTDDMAYNPLDKEGVQRLNVGDIVLVSGEMDNGFFESLEIEANHIVTLQDTSKES